MWTITEKQYTNEDGESYTGYGVDSANVLLRTSPQAEQLFSSSLTRLTGLTHRLSIFMR